MRQREVLDFTAEVRRGMSNLVERLHGMERLNTAQGNANEQAEEPNLRPNPPHHHAQEEHPVNDRNPPALRQVYQELVCSYGVSIRKCGDVMKAVLEGLAGIKVKSAPKKDFAASMIMEGRALSQIQVASEILNDSGGNLTLGGGGGGGDGTTKEGHHFQAFDVHLSSGECLVLGVREGVRGDRNEMLETMKDVINDVCTVFGAESKASNVVSKIKNTISDRHSAEKVQ